jgi:NAD(P)-dependent dehydrogenase (short-subunit alcohol dehydrogenase family)
MNGGSLQGLGIAVTGGGGDIGFAIGEELAREGAALVLLDRKSNDEAQAQVDRIKALGDVRYVTMDVRDRLAIERCLAAMDPLDIAIGNAGIVRSAPFLDLGIESWQETLDVNLTGCFNFGQLAARELVKRGRGGKIIFTGSWVQDVPWPEISAYSVSKAGLRMLARQMALELAPHKILVNILAPGIVDAGLARRQRETEPQYERRASQVIPLGAFGTPEQVARAAVFLCSPGCDYMTGATLLVDGGCSLCKFD